MRKKIADNLRQGHPRTTRAVNRARQVRSDMRTHESTPEYERRRYGERRRGR
jgi:hypothetical protein